jgi:hypothetical protein
MKMSNGINIKANTVNIYFNKEIEEYEPLEEEDRCQCGHNHDYICDDCESGGCDQHDYSCRYCEEGDCELHEECKNLEPLEELK